MTEMKHTDEPASAILCKACGLCCTGHLFIHAEFKSDEVDTTKALGLNVLQPDSETPMFSLPCPLWHGQCSIYTHPDKPSICSSFKCKLLRSLEEGQLPLGEALHVVEQARQLIQELDERLLASQAANFRRQLFEYLRQLERSALPTESENAFRLKAGALLVLFGKRFGVKGLFNRQEQKDPV